MIPHIQSGEVSCVLAAPGVIGAATLPAYAWAIGALANIAALVLVGFYVRKSGQLKRQIDGAAQRAAESERQRDSAQEELFRRLYDERELNRQKMQFEAQLSEYEKYSALAQLALGAAHEINNPLLGILSHLELELRGCEDPAQTWPVLRARRRVLIAILRMKMCSS